MMNKLEWCFKQKSGIKFVEPNENLSQSGMAKRNRHKSRILDRGSGINRIKSLVREQGLKVTFEVDDFFRIVFYRPRKIAPVEKIRMLLKDNSRITEAELAKKTGLSRRGVEWNIEQLKKAGKIKRIGGAKGGYWEVQ